jgi:ribose 5-phosphate isomerase B
MRVGIAADHAGFSVKQGLIANLKAAGHEVVDYGACRLEFGDDYPDSVIPLARAVGAGQIERGIAICTSAIGACVCANKVTGARAGVSHDRFAARQAVEDDHVNVLCLEGRTVIPPVAWNLVRAFLAAQFSGADRHLRRLDLVAGLEVTVGGVV